MATAPVTPQTNAPSATVMSSTPTIQPIPSTPTVDTSSSSPPSESTSTQPRAAVPHGQSAQEELSPQDFESLEDYAQALIDKKQSAASGQRSEPAKAESPNAEEHTLSQAGEDSLADDQSEDEEAGVAQETETQPRAAVPHELDLEGDELLTTKALDDSINANAALKQALEANLPLRNAMFRNARLAAEAAGYREIFPDVESARAAADQAVEKVRTSQRI